MRAEIKICLDEMEAAYRIMVSSKGDKKLISKCKGWARKHKQALKELKYKGKVPRQPKLKRVNNE